MDIGFNGKVVTPFQMKGFFRNQVGRFSPAMVGMAPKHRRLFIAQRGRCAYCGKPFLPHHLEGISHPLRPSRDHVIPIRDGGKLYLRNVLLVHQWCNGRKKARDPYPCEIVMAEAIGEIVLASYPKKSVVHVWPKQDWSKDMSWPKMADVWPKGGVNPEKTERGSDAKQKEKKMKYPLNEMEIGDSFFVPGQSTSGRNGSMAAYQAAKHYGNMTGKSFTGRTVVENGEEGVRIWRVE